MAAKRYAVIDKNGVCINSILVDDPMPKGYWPGYGKTLIPLEPVTFTKGGAGLDVVQFDKWPVIPQIGDTVDLATGTVTKFVPQITTQKDDLGQNIQVAEAPSVKLAQDAVAKPDGGTVTTKTSTATDPKLSQGGGGK